MGLKSSQAWGCSCAMKCLFQGGRAQLDISLAWLVAADISVKVDTARLETCRTTTDTVKELPGYSVQNCPSGSFLFWGGPVGRGGIVYDIVWKGCPRRIPWTMFRTPVCFLYYQRLSPQFQFSLSAVTLVYLSHVSALTAGAYTTTVNVMVDIVKGGGRAPPRALTSLSP
jgi:hypothetical protein